MKTSRISQDTARVTKALSARAYTSDMPVRRSLRQFGIKPEHVSHDDLQTDPKDESDLSSPPSTPNAEVEADPSTIKKRKRGPQSPATTKIVKIEEEVIRKSPRKSNIPASEPFPRKARRQPAKHIKGPTGSIERTDAPANWEEIYNATAEMRKLRLAPVDTMGCESLAEDHRSPRDRRLQTLIALMLSSQTKDTVTAVAMKNLQDSLPGGFCLESLIEVQPAILNELITKVGFHNNKTKYIKATAEIIRDKFGGEIPDTIEGMVSLPGVGPKMAYLCMSSAWGRDEGIGVDVHVHRITNLWGWHKTRNPEETRAELESWLPREKWHDINHLLVGFGQTWCLPVGRKCYECDLAVKGLCPSAVVPLEIKKRIKKEVKTEVNGQEEVKEEVQEDTKVKLEKADDDAPPLVLTPGGEPKGNPQDLTASNVEVA